MISNKLTFSLTIISLLLALMVFNVNAYDYPGNGWSHSANVIINTSATGLSADVSNYPLLIRLNSSNFDFNLAQSDGDDIRFTLSDGFTVVKYEKEMWDAIGQNAEIWVKIPVVYEDNSDQYIIMYWGNPSVSTQSYGPYVFERSNNFTAVYHMTDIDDVDDATENNPGGDYDGTNCGTAKVTGVIGNAFSFNGSDHIDIPGGVFSNISSQITVELWQYGDPAIQPQADRILWGLDSYGCRAINIIIPWDNGDIVFDAGNSGGYFSRIEKNTTNSSDYEGQWNHWTFIKNTSTGEMRMYLNGTEYYGEGSGNTYSINVCTARIGADHNGYQNYDGYLDEFRFSKVARSASWIKLSYESQKADQSVVTIEGKEPEEPEEPALPAEAQSHKVRIIIEADAGSAKVEYFSEVVLTPTEWPASVLFTPVEFVDFPSGSRNCQFDAIIDPTAGKVFNGWHKYNGTHPDGTGYSNEDFDLIITNETYIIDDEHLEIKNIENESAEYVLFKAQYAPAYTLELG